MDYDDRLVHSLLQRNSLLWLLFLSPEAPPPLTPPPSPPHTLPASPEGDGIDDKDEEEYESNANSRRDSLPGTGASGAPETLIIPAAATKTV